MTILEQAQADLARARRDASDARTKHAAAVARLNAAQERVDRLLVTKMELDHEQAVYAERRRAAKG